MTEAEYVAFIKEETDLDREAELYSLEHHGVKGQKWGVTRTPEQLGHKKVSKKKGLITKAKEFRKQQKKKAAARKRKAEIEVKKIAEKKAAEEAKKAEEEKARKEKEREVIRERVLKSSDPKLIRQHMDLLDTKELKDRIDRITQEQKIIELSTPKKKDTIKTAEDFLKSTASMAESALKVYNAFNAMTGKKSGKGKSQDSGTKVQESQDKKTQENQNKNSNQERTKNKSNPKAIKTVEEIMKDPAVQAIMNMPNGLTPKDRENILKRAQQEREKRKKNHFGFSN